MHDLRIAQALSEDRYRPSRLKRRARLEMIRVNVVLPVVRLEPRE